MHLVHRLYATPHSSSQKAPNAIHLQTQAQLRGALRGTTAPTTAAALAKELSLEAGGLTALLGGLLEELAAEGAVKGACKAGGTQWVPALHAVAQQDAARCVLAACTSALLVSVAALFTPARRAVGAGAARCCAAGSRAVRCQGSWPLLLRCGTSFVSLPSCVAH